MRRSMLALSAVALGASLAFAPVTAADEDGGTTLDLTAVADGAAVDGTLAFGGALATGSDAAGDASAPMAGLDVGDLRLEQQGRDLVVSLDVLDPTADDVAPTNLYRVNLPSNLALLAYRGPGAWDYQLADFSDGYASGDAQGSFDGSTITWTVPTSSVTNAGAQLAPGYLSSQGVSPGGLASLQLTGFVTADAGSAAALFNIGGRIDLDVTDAEGAIVDTAVTFADASGAWSYDASSLAPGNYTVTASSAYADLSTDAVTTVTVE